MQKEGRLAAEAEEMYHMKVYMVPFSVHGGGTSLIVDILSEFILDIWREDENRFERHIETEKAKIPQRKSYIYNPKLLYKQSSAYLEDRPNAKI
jgi:hypothetical protein